MAEITAKLVKELRDATNVGMMDCKRALVEADGDKDEAIKLLRERGVAIAGKKAGRAVKEGVVTAFVADDASMGTMIEVNCETDFVVRNEVFQAFVKELLEKSKELEDNTLADVMKDDLVAKIAEIGENIVIRRNVRFVCEGEGVIAQYIHLGGKVGVLLEVGCTKAETKDNADFAEMVKDITLHIAAANPQYLKRDEVPAETVDAERAIYAKQVENKPANIIDKIVDGKLNKFYSQICLVEQEFVKDNDLTITKLVEQTGKKVGDELEIRRFVRYQIGV
jgi:elongation factor Ts